MKKTLAAIAGGIALALAAPAAAPAKDKFCTDVQAISKLGDGFDKLGSADFNGAIKLLEDGAKKMKSAEGRAPGAIKKDWKTMSTAIGKMAKVVAKLKNVTLANAEKELAKVGPEIDKITSDKAVDKASDKVEAWAKKECGISL